MNNIKNDMMLGEYDKNLEFKLFMKNVRTLLNGDEEGLLIFESLNLENIQTSNIKQIVLDILYDFQKSTIFYDIFYNRCLEIVDIDKRVWLNYEKLISIIEGREMRIPPNIGEFIK